MLDNRLHSICWIWFWKNYTFGHLIWIYVFDVSSIRREKPFSGFGERRIYFLIQIRMILHGAMHALKIFRPGEPMVGTLWSIIFFLSVDRIRCFINWRSNERIYSEILHRIENVWTYWSSTPFSICKEHRCERKASSLFLYINYGG